MRPIKLIMTAFGAYAKRTELDFGDLGENKFFLITGQTGAGKTTILDAICFALYGDTTSGRAAKSVRSDHAAPDLLTEVEFTFAIGEKIYRARRAPEQARKKTRGEGLTQKPAEAELWAIENGEEILITASALQAAKKIEELLGFKSTQFRQVVLLPQGEFKKVLTADSVEREKIMQTLFQTEQYAAIERFLKESAKKIREENESAQKEADFILKEEGAESTAELAAIHKARLADFDAARKIQAQCKKNCDRLRQNLEKARQDADKLAELAAAKKALAEKEQLRPIVEKYRAEYEPLKRALPLSDIFRQKNDSVSQKNQAAENAAHLKKEQLKIQADFAKIKARYEALTGESDLRRRLAVENNKFAEWLSKAKNIAQLKEKLVKEETAAKAAKENLLRLKERLDKKEAEKAACGERLLSLTKAAGGAAAAKMTLAKLDSALKKYDLAEKIAAEEKAASVHLKGKRDALAEKETAWQQKKILSEKLHRLFIKGQAAILAESLALGAPCPVCGATSHPNLAKKSDAIPSEQEINALKLEWEELGEIVKKMQNTIAALEEAQAGRIKARQDALKEAAELSGNLSQKDTIAARAAAFSACQAAETAALAQNACRQESENLARDVKNLAAECEKLSQDERKEELAAESAKASLNALLKEIPKEYHDFAKLEESAEQAKIKYQQKEDEWQQQQEAYNDGGALAAAAAERAFSAERALKDALERAAKLAAEWDARLKAASLTQAEYDALLPHCRQSYIDKLYVKLENYDKEIKSLNDRLKRAAENAKNAEDIDLAALEGALKAAEANYNEELKLSGEMESANKKRGAHLADLQKLDAAMADFAARYGVIGHLAEIANGKNDFGVTFQRYVLGNLLDEVADAASERLKMMSRGRYLLQRTDERRRKNAQSGLELEIFDYYTGVARAVNTLSGGESFLASLSLSLGLADVVQNYAGGIKLDTIFIDEGFGTLDAESLDMALKTLIDLQSGGRLVGIISHVPELKERIDARLEVTGGRFGSTARFVLK